MKEPLERQLASLQSALLLVMIIGASGTIIAEELEHGLFQHFDSAHAVMWGGLVLLGGAYVLSRRSHYLVSANITVYVLSTLIWRLWAIELPNDPYQPSLYFLALPLALSALLLPLPHTLVFVALTLVTVFLVPSFASMSGATVAPGTVFNVVTFVVLLTSLLLTASFLLRQAQQRLAIANQRLKDVDRDRIQFTNQVAHDLANPLYPVKLQVEIIRRTLEQRPDLNLEKNLLLVRRNLETFELLLQDLRDLASLDAGRLRLEVAPVELHDLVRSVCDFHHPVAQAAGVELEAHVPSGVQALGDARRLRQVMNNLVANAIRFSPSDTDVKIAADARTDHVEVAVADRGRGLTSDEIGRLFRPFSQVHERSEVKERGTGLGLFICKGLVEAHGGRIWVESDGRGKGSTFRFTVPRPVEPVPRTESLRAP